MDLNRSKDNTIIILAGGESRRFDNRIKAFEKYRGISLLGHRVKLANELFIPIIVSVSSLDIQQDCENQLKSENINFSKVTFIVDKESAQGPMKALYYIIPKIKSKYCTVIGIDNIFIRNIDIEVLLSKLIETNANLISILLDQKRIVASFFSFEVEIVIEVLSSYQFVKHFERLTDLYRIIPHVALLDITGNKQFENINTPAQLLLIDTTDNINLESRNFYNFETQYYKINDIGCESFIRELKSWRSPVGVEHIVRNIISDARKELNVKFNDCNLEL